MIGSRTFLVLAVVAVAVLGTAALGEGAQQSFEGSCSPIEGTTHFDPPITGETALHRFEFHGEGRCDQTINGQRLFDVPVEVQVGGPIEASCSAARSVGPVPGEATWKVRATNVRVQFLFLDNTGILTEFEGRIVGDRSGSGRVRGTFLTPRTPPDTALKCATTGLADVPTDISTSTDSPIVSGNLPARCRGKEATVTGTKRDDVLVGTRGPDVIAAGGGNDRVNARSGNDRVCGAGGDDRVRGQKGPDRLYGGDGADYVNGGPGADRLNGGAGRNSINGGPGADRCGGMSAARGARDRWQRCERSL